MQDFITKGVSQKTGNKTKAQRYFLLPFFGILLGTLSTSLLGNMSEGKEEIIASNGVIEAGQCF